MNCPHCYLGAGDAAEKELTTEECFSLIDELDTLGTEMLILTGGEPLLRRDIFEIAHRASQKGMWIVMGTNGVIVNDNIAGRMVECGVKGVGISIDSIHPETHNRFRGSPHAWRRAVRALEICRSQGLDVLVQTTVVPENQFEIGRLLEFARAHNARSFNAYFLIRTGRGKKMSGLTPEETEVCLRMLVEAQNDYKPMFVRAKCAPQFKQLAYEMGGGGLESGGCMAGTQYCRITPEGDVTPCPYMELTVGNVRSRGFADIWHHSEVFSELRNLDALKGRCGICEFKALCGGCRCRAYATVGDYLAEDPACMYRPGTLKMNEEPEIVFSESVVLRLERIPIEFIRKKVRSGLIAYATRHEIRVVGLDDMEKAISGSKRGVFPRREGASSKESLRGDS